MAKDDGGSTALHHRTEVEAHLHRLLGEERHVLLARRQELLSTTGDRSVSQSRPPETAQ